MFIIYIIYTCIWCAFIYLNVAYMFQNYIYLKFQQKYIEMHF